MEASYNNFANEDMLNSIGLKSKAVISNCQTFFNSNNKLNNTDIVIWINDLHKALDDDYEAGIQINHLKKEVTFYIDHIAHKNDSLIYFKGKTEEGKMVHFVKHASDLNIRLIALKRRVSDQLKTPFGFADWKEYENQRSKSYLDD